MNEYLSDKLKVIGFISMILVVYIHSYNINVNYTSEVVALENGYSSFIQNFLSQGVARAAVPLYFIISGYLFFLNINRATLWGAITKKVGKRINSLLIPFMFWSIAGIFLYYLLQTFPASKNYFTQKLVQNYSSEDFLFRIFIEPVPYQLWFIRDLFLIVLLSPFIYYTTRHLRVLPIIFLIPFWFFNWNPYIFELQSLLFFMIGAYFAINKIKPESIHLSKTKSISLWAFWILTLFLKTFLIHSQYENYLLIVIIHKFCIALGIVVVWLLYDQFSINKPLWIRFKIFSQFSFFLYLSHEPILTILRKSGYTLLGKSEMASLILYLLLPVLVVVFCIAFGFVLKKGLPRFYLTITGGR
ncbi:MAG: surface polysaccharide O-acyltransferase-like enzyme [Parvicella sp.]|jgi:surface polysaccharide O-acyltransferase-like enzyme